MGVSADLRNYIKELKPICEYCKNNPTQEIHHIDCNQKNNSVSNLMAVCKKCHRAKGNKAETHPKLVIYRIIKKCNRKHRDSGYHKHFDLFKELKKYLLKRCPSNCICLKRK